MYLILDVTGSLARRIVARCSRKIGRDFVLCFPFDFCHHEHIVLFLDDRLLLQR